MSRGLGKWEKAILKELEHKIPKGQCRKYTESIAEICQAQLDGYKKVGNVMWMVINRDLPDGENRKVSNIEKQSMWRAIRRLENKELIKSRIAALEWDRRSDSSDYEEKKPGLKTYEHKGNTYAYYDWGLKKGCANKLKLIRLVQ